MRLMIWQTGGVKVNNKRRKPKRRKFRRNANRLLDSLGITVSLRVEDGHVFATIKQDGPIVVNEASNESELQQVKANGNKS